MGEETKIQWTHHTFNPWRAARRSPQAVRTATRRTATSGGTPGENWGPESTRFQHTESYWRQPRRWNREALEAGERRRVFCASLGDVFEDRRDLDPLRARLWALIEETPALDWLLLTKRPENAIRLAAPAWIGRWPENVWAGTTVEDQKRANERVPRLLAIPAAVRFLSCEPLLEPVDLTRIVEREFPGTPPGHVEFDGLRGFCASKPEDDTPAVRGLQWVIVGGESGLGARPFDLAWARSIVEQCKAAGVPCFVKQLGADPIDGAAGGEVWQRHPKGGDPEEWPEELRVREFPIAGGVS